MPCRAASENTTTISQATRIHGQRDYFASQGLMAWHAERKGSSFSSADALCLFTVRPAPASPWTANANYGLNGA